MPHTDTSEDAERVQFDLLRRMSPEQRASQMRALTLAVQELAFAGLRARFPEASDDEIWMRLAVQRLGRDVVRKVYGILPEGE